MGKPIDVPGMWAKAIAEEFQRDQIMLNTIYRNWGYDLNRKLTRRERLANRIRYMVSELRIKIAKFIAGKHWPNEDY